MTRPGMHVCHVCHQPTNYYKSDFSISLLTKPQSEQRNQPTNRSITMRLRNRATTNKQTNRQNSNGRLCASTVITNKATQKPLGLALDRTTPTVDEPLDW